MKQQTTKGSIIEAIVNTFIGFLITCAVAPLVYKTAGFKRVTAWNLGYANVAFTLISVLRNYVIRRVFNRTNIFTYKSKQNDTDR